MNYDLSADGGLVHYTEKFNKHYKQGFQLSDMNRNRLWYFYTSKTFGERAHDHEIQLKTEIMEKINKLFKVQLLDPNVLLVTWDSVKPKNADK